jgi:hypothetical protein
MLLTKNLGVLKFSQELGTEGGLQSKYLLENIALLSNILDSRPDLAQRGCSGFPWT